MEIGVQLIFQSFGYPEGFPDQQVVDEEIRLSLLADELGFDALWPVEHHFEDYSFCPDNTEFLAYIGARTKQIKLATGAVILPWHPPLRVAERIAFLDSLTGGRVIFGMGRGLSRKEYEPMGIPMGESRERFDEAAPMILEALETGFIEGDGKFYPQARAAIRPKPTRSFKGRASSVAMSPDSAVQAGKLGVRMVLFSEKPYDQQYQSIDLYRQSWRETHGTEPLPPMICDFTMCHTDAGRAEELAREHIGGYLASVLHHYEIASDHYKETKGYEHYASQVDTIKKLGFEGMYERYLSVQCWGTPEQILDKYAKRRQALGPFNITGCFRYAGLPVEEAEASMRLYAKEVMPQLRQWAAEDEKAA